MKEIAIRYPEMAAHILGGPLFIFPYHPIAGLYGTKGDRMGIVHEDMIMGYETNHLGMCYGSSLGGNGHTPTI